MTTKKDNLLSEEQKDYLKRLDQTVYDIFSIVKAHLETRTNNINKKLGSYYRDRRTRLGEIIKEDPLGRKTCLSGLKLPLDIAVLLEERDSLILRKINRVLLQALSDVQKLRNLPPNETETGIRDEDLRIYLESLYCTHKNHLSTDIASQYFIKKTNGEYLYNNKPVVFNSLDNDYFKLFDSLYDATSGGGEISYLDLYRAYRSHKGKKPDNGESLDKIKHKFSNLIESFFVLARVGQKPIPKINLEGKKLIKAITGFGLRFDNKR